MSTRTHTTLATGAGPLVLVADGATLVAAGFCDADQLLVRLGTGSVPMPDLGALGSAVGRYLDGALDALDGIEVRQPGTALQQRVWRELRTIPVGETVSYGELAARLGLTPGASRAVGSACGANLVAPVVPCHRVVRSDGGLGGYAYGLSVKQWLLRHEGVPQQQEQLTLT